MLLPHAQAKPERIVLLSLPMSVHQALCISRHVASLLPVQKRGSWDEPSLGFCGLTYQDVALCCLVVTGGKGQPSVELVLPCPCGGLARGY